MDAIISPKKLNKAAIEALTPSATGNKIVFFPGAVIENTTVPRGFGVRTTAAGVKSFILDYRHKGRQHRITIGRYPDWNAVKAVHRARELRQQIDAGEDPIEERRPSKAAAPVTVADVFNAYLVDPRTKALRSFDQYKSDLQRLAVPIIGSMAIGELKRSHITKMLDTVERENGASAAHLCLAHVRAALNWYALRDDGFVPPFARGMGRINTAQQARSRILSDDEIRAIWPHLDALEKFGAIAKLLLLTGQRRNEVAGMAWAEIEGDTWIVPASRYKTKREHVVPLSKAALAVIEAQTRRNDSRYVFPSQVATSPYVGFDPAKAKLDKLAPLPHWTPHDLRRTARSLMARAGVLDSVAERVLGHVQPGIVSTYNRHAYADEKRDALERLAALVGQIVGNELMPVEVDS